MKCIHPTRFNKKSGFQRCNVCIACIATRKQKWITRLIFELRACHNVGSFVTLTYDPLFLPEQEKYPGGNLQKSDVQKFIKRIRKRYGTGIRISYYAVGEYGDKNERAHYHICLFGVDAVRVESLVQKSWPHGFARVDPLGTHSFQQLNYTMGYTLKKMTKERDYPDGRQPEFGLMSKNPALGVGYLKKFESTLLKMKKYPSSGATQYERWYMEKYYPDIKPWKGDFKTEGRNMMLDRYMSRKLFAAVYGKEIRQAEEHNQKYLSTDKDFQAFKRLDLEDNEILSKKFIRGDEITQAISLTERAQRRYNNALAFRS